MDTLLMDEGRLGFVSGVFALILISVITVIRWWVSERIRAKAASQGQKR
jgi:hypothetical protein